MKRVLRNHLAQVCAHLVRIASSRGNLTKTNTKHLAGTDIDETNAKVTTKSGSINEDGNNVNVTSEMISLTKNNQMYALAISALNYNSSINTASRGK